jgi:signal transduction histidine kinase/ligand-binding sensor domain-containing protein
MSIQTYIWMICALIGAASGAMRSWRLSARALLSLVLGACAFSQSARPTDTLNPSLFQLQHTSWKERDGAPPQINGIAQAPDGSLWLGSGEGLYRFDGFTFERVRSIDADSPAPTEITSLLATSNGELWIGTSYSGAILLRNGVAKRFPKFEGIPLNTTVWTFVEDLDGTVWAGTALGLQRFDGSQWRSIGNAWGVPEMVRFMLQLDSDGTLWAGAYEHGLFRLKRGAHHFEHPSDVLLGGRFFDQSPSGENWASSKSGICPFAEAQTSSSCEHWAFRNNESSPSSFFSAYYNLTFDRRGNLWMSPWQGTGIKRLDAAAFRDAFRPDHPQGKMESFTKRDGLTSDRINSVFRDRRDGSIWVGTDHGLDHFREALFVPVVPQPGTNNFGIQAQKDGRVWIGSDGGGLWIASAGGKAAVTLPDTHIQSLYEAQHGTLWFATFQPLVVASIRDDPNDGKTTGLPLTPELQSQVAVQSIIEDRGGAVWASFIPYGLAKWEGGHWTRNGGLTGLPEAWVVILNTGPDGRIWAGYMNGDLAVIDGTSVRRYTAKDGLNIGPVAALLSGGANCWLSGPNGLVRFDGQGFHMLAEANNRPFSGITGIALAKNGDLWLNAWDGVRRIAAAELRQAEKNPGYAVHSDLYDLTDGLPSVPQRIRPFPTAVSAPDGRIWFGFRAGVVSVDPEDPSLSSPVPPVSIVRAIADGKTFDAATSATLAARTKNLEIDYSAVSLNRASRVRFRYKLEGLDAGWRDAGSRRQAFYNDLPPGKYQFVVSASNGDDLWNEAGATLNVEVPPAFNQTTWFRASCVIAFFALLWALHRYRLYQIRHEFDARLEERVGERTRIARDFHDTLLQSFQGLLFRFQAVRELHRTRPAEAEEILESALDQAAQAITEGREAVQGLRASTVETNDLAVAIKTLGGELAAEGSVHSSTGLSVEVQGTSRTLHPIVRDEIYRIAGEALRNAFRHAEANQIEVELHFDERQLRLRIRDDGKGIDPEFLTSQGREGHFGIHGMRERAELISGKLTVWTAQGSGTEIELSVPAVHAFAASSARWRSWLTEKLSGSARRSGNEQPSQSD